MTDPTITPPAGDPSLLAFDPEALARRIQALPPAVEEGVTAEELERVLRGKLAGCGFRKRTIDLVVAPPLLPAAVAPRYGEVADAAERAMLAGKLVALLGPQGRGKTALAAIVAAACLKERRVVHYTTLYDLGLRLEAAQAEQADESRWFIKREMAGVAVLIVDEIGKGFDTPAMAKFVHDLWDARYGNERGTLLIANLGAAPVPVTGEKDEADKWARWRASADKELAAVMGPSAYDRLREAGGLLYSDWESLRQ